MVVPELQDERLLLRALRPEDAKDLAAEANHLNVARWLAGVPYPFQLDDAAHWIRVTAERAAAGDYLCWGIAHKVYNKIMGNLGCYFDHNSQIATFGFWLGRKYQGHGYMPAAIRLAIAHVFSNTAMTTIQAVVARSNRASELCLGKTGFAPIGDGPVEQLRFGPTTTQIWQLTKNDYLSRADFNH